MGALGALVLGVLGVAYIFQPFAATGATAGVKAETSVRARVTIAPPSHAGQLRSALRRAQPGISVAGPLGTLREATYEGALFALATFRVEGAPTTHRFKWQKGSGWTSLGETDRAHPTGLPAAVLSAWHFKLA
jgi:hypothetical protein